MPLLTRRSREQIEPDRLGTAPRGVVRRSGPLAALLVAVAVVAAVLDQQRGFTDLEVYRLGGRAVIDGLTLYGGSDPESGLPFTYPPFAAVAMMVIAAPPAMAAAALWAVVGVAALATTLALVRREGAAPLSGTHLAVLTASALLLEPVWGHVGFGQINLLLMLAITVDVLRPERRWAGVLVGVAAGIKLTPLVFVVLLVLIGHRSAAARAVGAFAATVGVGFVVLPGDSASYWTHVLWDTDRIGRVAYSSNQSVNGVLARLTDGSPPTLVWLVVAGTIAGAVLLVAAAWWRRGRRDLGLCLAAVSMLLASPVTWSHHWVWAAPACLVLWRWAGRWAAAVWFVLFVSCVVKWPPHGVDSELAWAPVEQLIGNAYVWAALLMAGWAGYALLRTRPYGGQLTGAVGEHAVDRLRPRELLGAATGARNARRPPGGCG